MFDETDFDVFQIAGVTQRLSEIKTRLDPKFVAAGEVLQALAATHGIQPYLHIAKHARRHTNPPVNTWLALSQRPRGYKMVPHIELGFWDDRLFLWVGVLQEAKPFLLPLPLVVPTGFVLAGAHTKKATQPADAQALARLNQRFDTVASAEWLVGKQYLRTDDLWQRPAALWAQVQADFERLLPLYAQLCGGVQN